MGSGTSVAGNEIFSLSGSGKFSDRPTITYAPITGTHFNKSYMTPIPPRAILFLMQSGWAVDLIFPLTTNSINGLKSRMDAGVNQHEGDKDYYRVVSLLHDIQKSGAVGMRLLKNTEGQDSTVIFFYDKNIKNDIKAKFNEVNKILGITPGTRSIKVSYGAVPETNQEMAIMTLSLLQIMIKLAAQVDVPEQHVKEGRTPPSIKMSDEQEKNLKLINIKHSLEKPENNYTAIKYRDH